MTDNKYAMNKIDEILSRENFLKISKIKTDITRATNRMHILEGYLITAKNINRVLEVLSDPDSKEKLKSEFGLSKKQISAILNNFQLKHITPERITKMESELQALYTEKAKLEVNLAQLSGQTERII